MVFGIVSSALKAATAYLNFKRETALDERIDRSRQELRRIQTEIESLRDSGDAYATRRADWLRSDYKAEALHLSHLKSLRPRYTSTESRNESSDS